MTGKTWAVAAPTERMRDIARRMLSTRSRVVPVTVDATRAHYWDGEDEGEVWL